MLDVNINVPDKVTVKVPGLEKLLDVSVSGIGAVAGSILAPWMAKQQARAKAIEDKSHADSLRLIAQAQADARQALLPPNSVTTGTLKITPEQIRQRLEFQEQKRQHNIQSAVREAAHELGDEEVPDHEPDHDWTARFFEYVQDVSEEDVRMIWARILAGQVRSPGTVSLRTLSILRNMSRREAELFAEAMRYRIDDYILERFCLQSSSQLTSYHLTFTFEDMGLFFSPINARPGRSIRALDKDGITTMVNADHILFLAGKPRTSIDLNDKVVLKQTAMELAPFCDAKSDLAYLRHFARHLAGKNCRLSTAPILATTSEGYRYDRRKIRIVEPI